MATAPFPGMPTQAVTEHKFTVQATIDGATGEGKVSSTKELSITTQAGTSDISITSGSGTYTYGDTITLYGSIAASATPPASNGINAITEPAQNWHRTRWGYIWMIPSLPQRMLERVERLP